MTRSRRCLLGAFISEGFVSEHRAGFNNVDRDYLHDGGRCV